MGSKALEAVTGKSESCPTSTAGIESCAQELTSPDSKLVSTAAPESTQKMLAGFSIDSENAQNAALTTTASALAVGLGGAGFKSVQIGGERLAAVATDIPFRIAGSLMGNSEVASGSIARQILSEPFAPRVLGAGAKFGLYGAAAGLAAYGLYEGYQYLNSDK